MSCPRCGGPTEQDNLWALCMNDKCSYMFGGEPGSHRGSFILAKDSPGLAKTEEEVQRRNNRDRHHS